MGEHTGAIAAAAITAAGGVLAALIGTGVLGGGDGDGNGGSSSPTTAGPQPTFTIPTIPTAPTVPTTRTSLFVNRDSGAGGTTVLLSGEGFAPGDRVRFRLHTEQIGTTTANAEGRFANVAVTIPKTFSAFAPQQMDLVAEGESPRHSARTPFTVTG